MLHLTRFCSVERDGLLAQDMFASADSRNGPGLVKTIRQWNVDRINLWVIQWLLIRTIRIWSSKLFRYLLGLLRGPAGHSVQNGSRGFQNCGYNLTNGDVGATHDSPPN